MLYSCGVVLPRVQEERDADRQKLQQLTSLIIGAKVIERAAKVCAPSDPNGLIL
jgi:hypothetical protein